MIWYRILRSPQMLRQEEARSGMIGELGEWKDVEAMWKRCGRDMEGMWKGCGRDVWVEEW